MSGASNSGMAPRATAPDQTRLSFTASTVWKNCGERKSKYWETEVWVSHSILEGNKLTRRNSLAYPGSRGFCMNSLRKCGRAQGRWAQVRDLSLSPSPVIPLGRLFNLPDLRSSLCSGNYNHLIYFTSVSCRLKVAQTRLTLCSPMDCNPPGSSFHRISQAKILEWVAIPFSRESSYPRDRTWVSCHEGRFFPAWTTSCED